MKIARICPMCGALSIKDIDTTREKLNEYAQGARLIQEVFPNLSAEDREYLKTGCCDDCMDRLFNFEEVM